MSDAAVPRAQLDAAAALTKDDEVAVKDLARAMAASRRVFAKDEGIARFYRIARITLDASPARIADKGLYRVEALSVHFPFPEPVSAPVPLSEFTDRDRGFGRVLANLVANPEAFALYASRKQGQPNTPPQTESRWSPLEADPAAKWFRIPIVETDFYRIREQHLRAAGLEPVAVHPDDVSIFSRGEEVPAHLAGPRGNAFAEGNSLIFYGQASESRFSRERAYWVRVAPSAKGTGPGEEDGKGPPVAPQRGAPARIVTHRNPTPLPQTVRSAITTPCHRVVEQNENLLIMSGDFLSIEGQAWVWKELGRNAFTLFPFDLPFRDPRDRKPLPLELHLVHERQPRIQMEEREDGRMMISFDAEEDAAPQGPPQIPPLVLRINDTLTTRLAGERAEKSPESNSKTWTYRVQVDPAHFRDQGNVFALGFEPSSELEQMRAPQEPYSGVFVDFFTMDYIRGLIPEEGRVEILTQGESPWHRTAGFSSPGPDGTGGPLVFDLTTPDVPTLAEALALPVTRERPLQTHLFHEPRAGRRLVAVEPSTIRDAPGPEPLLNSTIAQKNNAAQYLIIYHGSLKEPARTLAEFHQAQGLKVRTVDVAEIYQEFSGGEPTPHAIKDFLLHALRHWQAPPIYVCLFGDATSDYRGELASGVDNLVPAYTYKSSEGDAWASEIWYATLVGPDLMPDVVLSRVPARYPADADTMARKAIEYQTRPPLGPWRARLGFCSDDDDPHSRYEEATEILARDFRPPGYAAERVYAKEFSYEDNFFLPEEVSRAQNLKISTAATLKFLETVDRGVDAMFFMGHGSPNIWTDERLWFGGESPNSDNLNLRNGGRLPFVAAFTCNQGAFDYPMPRWHVCISEDMMRVPHGGCIGLFLPTGPGGTDDHEKIAHPLLQALFRDGTRRLGEAVAQALCACYLAHGPEEIIRMFVLLGDPALPLAAPARSGTGRVSPRLIPLSEVPAGQTIVFEGETEGAEEGRFAASLHDERDREIFCAPPQAFQKGRIRWSHALPPDARPGQWTVRAYYGNDATAKDGCLFATFRIAGARGRTPEDGVRIRAFSRAEQSQSDPRSRSEPSSQRRESPVKPGKKVPLFLEIVNESDLPLRGVPVRVETLAGVSTEPVDSYEKTLDLDPREERTLQISPRTKARLTVFRAAAGKPDPLRRRILPFFIPGDQNGAAPSGSLFSHPDLVQCQWDAYDPTVRATVTVPIYYAGIPEREVWYASLLDEEGKIVSEARVVLGEDNAPSGEKDLRFRLRVGKEDLKPVYRLRIAPATASPSTEAAAGQTDGPHALLEMDVLPGPPRLPDLALDPDSVEFAPTRPMEGESVFMRARIENKGNVPSGPFQLRLSSTRWGRVQELLSPRPYIPQLKQASLNPGEDRTIALRWDYSAYTSHAGEQTIRLEVDPFQRITEINEGNNSAESAVRIFTRPKPKVTGVETRFETLPDGKRRVDVRATVKNLGESVARNYYLGVFRKRPPTLPDYQNPAYLVREIPLPPLAENEEASLSHQWEIESRPGPTPTDDDTSPTAVVYRPTRTIRSKLHEGSQPVVEW